MFGLLGSVGTAQGQTIVITAKSLTELGDDLEYLIKSVAPEGDPMAQAVLNGLDQFKSGAMLKGLDQSRGFGLAVTLPKDFPQGGPPTVVAAVPVTDLGQFLDSLKELGLAVNDQPGVAGFSHKVTAPNGNPTVFVLQSKGYALFSLVPDGADQLKALDPSSWKPKGRAEPALSVKVRLSEIPEALKDQFLNQVEAQADQQNERKPGEEDAEYRARLAGQKVGHGGRQEPDPGRRGDRTRSRSEPQDVGDRPRVRHECEAEHRDGEDATGPEWPAEPLPGPEQGCRHGRLGQLPGRQGVPGPDLRGLRQGGEGRLERSWIPSEEKKLASHLAELVKSTLNAPEIDLGIAIQGTSPAGPGPPGSSLLGGMRVQKVESSSGWFARPPPRSSPTKTSRLHSMSPRRQTAPRSIS